MPSTFISEQHSGITTKTEVYVGKASTEAIIIGFHIANVSAGTVTVDVERDSATLGKDIPIPIGSTLVPFEGKLVVEDGETLSVTASDVVDVSLSILELTP